MNKPKLAIGIMSGTSLDGIDVSLASIKGTYRNIELIPIYEKTYPYDENILKKVKKAIANKANTKEICSLNVELAVMYSNCVNSLLKEAGYNADDISFIASHGQTVYHMTDNKIGSTNSSLQLGSGSVIANLTKINVVSNFRLADIANNGKGAPLVPYYDFCMLTDKKKNRIVNNLGGISNITILKHNSTIDECYAFDTGPANMLIDEGMKILFKKNFDLNGEHAKKGNIIANLYNDLINHPYYKLEIPKSTGREEFGKQYLEQILKPYINENPFDIIHTISVATIDSIIKSYERFVFNKLKIDEIILCGGGAYNDFIVNYFKGKLVNISILTMEDLNLSSNFKEAHAFIVLGHETINNFAKTNVLGATGANISTILGDISLYKGI